MRGGGGGGADAVLEKAHTTGTRGQGRARPLSNPRLSSHHLLNHRLKLEPAALCDEGCNLMGPGCNPRRPGCNPMCAGGIDLQMPAFCVCIVLVVFTLSFVVNTYEALTPTLLTMLTTLTTHTMQVRSEFRGRQA